MKPAPFQYARARSLEHAHELLDDGSDAKVLAGGQSLMPLMNLRLARPSLLVDITDIRELDTVVFDDASVTIGSLVRHRRLELDRAIGTAVPLLSEAAGHIGHVAIRNRGTVGGSLAHADPAAELPAVMLAIKAIVCVESARGRREIEAANLFHSHYITNLAEDEIITSVRVPKIRATEGWGFVEFSRRPGDFALSGAACIVNRDAAGRISEVRAVLIGASDTPLLVSDQSADGLQPSADLARELAKEWTVDWRSGDHHRHRMATVALERALVSAMGVSDVQRSVSEVKGTR